MFAGLQLKEVLQFHHHELNFQSSVGFSKFVKIHESKKILFVKFEFSICVGYHLKFGVQAISAERELDIKCVDVISAWGRVVVSGLILLSDHSERRIRRHLVVPQTEPPNVRDVLKQRLQPCVGRSKLSYTIHIQSLMVIFHAGKPGLSPKSIRCVSL